MLQRTNVWFLYAKKYKSARVERSLQGPRNPKLRGRHWSKLFTLPKMVRESMTMFFHVFFVFFPFQFWRVKWPGEHAETLQPLHHCTMQHWGDISNPCAYCLRQVQTKMPQTSDGGCRQCILQLQGVILRSSAFQGPANNGWWDNATPLRSSKRPVWHSSLSGWSRGWQGYGHKYRAIATGCSSTEWASWHCLLSGRSWSQKGPADNGWGDNTTTLCSWRRSSWHRSLSGWSWDQQGSADHRWWVNTLAACCGIGAPFCWNRFLVESGADIDRITRSGKTALDVALEYGHQEIGDFLASFQAKEPPRKVRRRDTHWQAKLESRWRLAKGASVIYWDFWPHSKNRMIGRLRAIDSDVGKAIVNHP